MTIKEFSHKNGLVFFWTTIILAVLLLITMTFSCLTRFERFSNDYRYKNETRQDRNIRGIQRPMMNGQGLQSRLNVTDVDQSTTSVNTSVTNQ
jgi:hypothetical protein